MQAIRGGVLPEVLDVPPVSCGNGRSRWDALLDESVEAVYRSNVHGRPDRCNACQQQKQCLHPPSPRRIIGQHLAGLLQRPSTRSTRPQGRGGRQGREARGHFRSRRRRHRRRSRTSRAPLECHFRPPSCPERLMEVWLKWTRGQAGGARTVEAEVSVCVRRLLCWCVRGLVSVKTSDSEKTNAER